MGIEAIAGACAWLSSITPMKPEQWEIRLAQKPTGDPKAWDVLSEFPNLKIPEETQSISACEGRYVIPLQKDSRPSGAAAVKAMLIALEKDSSLAAVVAKLVTAEGVAHPPALPSLAQLGATCFRKTVIDKIDGLPSFGGPAADYDLTFRILGTHTSIARREDIIFFTDAAETDAGPSAIDIANQLAIAHWYLPPKLARIYWDDWALRLKALGKGAGQWALLRARMNSIKQMLAAPDPVSHEVVESVFGFREHATAIGEWARRESVWRVILADFGDNLWATYNACRSSGLQMRCVADNNSAFQDLAYRDLPIVHASRAFEGGGIDGVIVTDSEPGQIDATYKSIRSHFHGPILRLWQTPRPATHLEAQAA
jgi:hypothetical protein